MPIIDVESVIRWLREVWEERGGHPTAFTKIRRTGKNYMMCCPYHDETTPSFGIHEESGLYHCFGCDAKGHIVDLVSYVLDISVLEAKKVLRRYTDTLQTNILINTEERYPTTSIPPPTGHISLVERGIPWDVQKRYEIGVDYEREEIVLPVRDLSGHVVSVKRRSYKRRSFRHIGPKGKALYGAYYTVRRWRNQGKAERKVYVVEGEIDALAFAVMGLDAVALMGASISEEQMQQLLALAPTTVVLALDNDETGEKAAQKIASRLLHLPFRIYVAQYPSGVKDAADALSAGVIDMIRVAPVTFFTRGRRESPPF